MSRLVAANAFNVPEATLRRHLKKNEKREKHHYGLVTALHITSSQPLDVSFFGPLKPSIAKHVTILGHSSGTITDKDIECRIKPPNPLEFSEHDFSAANTTDHDVIGGETENNSVNPKTLVVEKPTYKHFKETRTYGKMLIPIY
ncbi:hypothetical protein TNCV_2445191 [Trichonephila clavipes]|nr:hypothetical protein TNCV_2445191 [Trichonephila clavipes]